MRERSQWLAVQPTKDGLTHSSVKMRDDEGNHSSQWSSQRQASLIHSSVKMTRDAEGEITAVSGPGGLTHSSVKTRDDSDPANDRRLSMDQA